MAEALSVAQLFAETSKRVTFRRLMFQGFHGITFDLPQKSWDLS
jgi:hypothetical protein